MSTRTVMMNRAPVFTLWGAVVAERLGYASDEALSLAKVMAGLTAQKKGRRLGIYKSAEVGRGAVPRKTGLGEEMWITLCGRPVPAKRTDDGVRAVVGDKPEEPLKVQAYLQKKFGEDLDEVRAAMQELADSFTPEELEHRAYPLYERFRPEIPSGRAGWGAKGELSLELIRSLCKSA